MSTRTAIYAITGNGFSALSVGFCTLRHQTPCAVSGFRPKVKDCTEGQSCLFFVEAEMGVSFVTSRDEDSIGNGMQIVDLEDPAPVLTVALAQRRNDPSPYVKQLVALARSETS